MENNKLASKIESKFAKYLNRLQIIDIQVFVRVKLYGYTAFLKESLEPSFIYCGNTRASTLFETESNNLLSTEKNSAQARLTEIFDSIYFGLLL